MDIRKLEIKITFQLIIKLKNVVIFIKMDFVYLFKHLLKDLRGKMLVFTRV